MRSRSLFSSLLTGFLVIAVLGVGAATWFAASTLRDFHLQEIRGTLDRHLDAVDKRIAEDSDPDLLLRDLSDAAELIAARLTLVDSTGKVHFDSEADTSTMEDHRWRPEILQAAKEGRGEAIRYSATRGVRMIYRTLKVHLQGEPMYLRLSLPVESVFHSEDRLRWRMAIAGIGISLVAGFLAWMFTRRVSRPLLELKVGAERFMNGRLDRRIPLSRWTEIRAIADAMNRMAYQLDERIQHAIGQSNETEAILGSMIEGVVAVDDNGKILRCNDAFRRLFGLAPTRGPGQLLVGVVRQAGMEGLLSEFAASDAPVVRDISPVGEQTRTLQVRGTVLRDAIGSRIGELLVFNDVTRLRQLEEIRKDFVANVSHELKTPITSIKGFVETLQSSDDGSDPQRQRFLGIVSRHADRMNAIIDDLLTLSRLEHGGEGAELEFTHVDPADVVGYAVGQVSTAAAERQIGISVESEPGLKVWGNSGLLEQAVVNLVGNAVKYSDPGRKVVVKVREDQDRVLFEVQDNGWGIEERHLPRIFERFYRVDKARSRSLGGTGLGLAITKHIALLHSGRVEVSSVVGKGSMFTISLPQSHERTAT